MDRALGTPEINSLVPHLGIEGLSKHPEVEIHKAMKDRAIRLREFARIEGVQTPTQTPPSRATGETDSAIDRFLLVEQNPRSGCKHGSLHVSQEQAAVYSQGQEYPHEWTPVALYDLDTGDRYDAMRETRFIAAC